MATYRTIHISFWTDPKVDDDFTPEDKYFYLYLLTNPHTNLCGCYEISMKQMVRETGYNEDTVNRLLNRMEYTHNVIQYCKDTKEVLIPKWGKYNWCNSPKTREGASKAVSSIKSNRFRKFVSDTLSIPYEYPMDTSVTVTDTDTVPVSDSEDENFELFWSIYPKKRSKGTAKKAFDKALKKTPFDTIMDKLALLKNTPEWTKKDGEYIPYPATWLNAEGWNDEVRDGNDNLKRLYEMTLEEEDDKE